MLAILFGLIVGLALGLTGGGGSIFAIPLLVFGLGLSATSAITVSLATVAVISLVGTVSVWKNRLLELRAGIIFAIAGILFAPVGVMIANGLSEYYLLSAFACLMLLMAGLMWRKSREVPLDSYLLGPQPAHDDGHYHPPPCQFNAEKKTLSLTAPCTAVLILVGVCTGILSGLFGVGGGFIIVPALTLVTQLDIKRAVATSLFVITLISGSALFSSLVSGREVDLIIAGPFLIGGVVGMLLGRVVADKLSGPLLQKCFAVMIVIVAVLTLLKL